MNLSYHFIRKGIRQAYTFANFILRNHLIFS